MTLAQLRSGEAVFLDANPFVYHFEPHPTHGPACSQVIQRIEQGDVLGFTSTHVLSEVAHRLMMLEAAALPGWKPTKVKLRLRQHPKLLLGLTLFSRAIESV